MSDQTTSAVRCQCGVKLRVPPNAAGKRIRCPKCGFRIAITADGATTESSAFTAPTAASASPVARPAAPAPPVRRPAAPKPAPDEGDSLLDDLMLAESSATTTAGADLAAHQKICPSCKSAMAKNAQVCVMCGHDLKARPATAPVAKAAKAKAAATGAARTGGRFLIGCALSAAGALVGGLIWFGVAVATEREFGLIAILVGALAGGGMALGYRTPSALAGWVAVLTTIGGIIGAKILIFAFVMYSMFSGKTDDVSLQREYVKYQMVEQRLDEDGVFSPKERMDKGEQYQAEITAQVDALSDAGIQQKYQEYHAAEADTEADDKRSRLADHRATQRMREAGAVPWGDEYNTFINEENASLAALTTAQLDAEIAALDAWEADGQWADAKHVRNYLVYEKAEPACDAELEDLDWDEDSDYSAKYAAAWQKHHAAAVTQVDALSPEDQLREARAIEAEHQRQMAEWESNVNDALGDLSGADIALGLGALIVVFFIAMFGIFGTIFTIIASVTASRVASNGFATSG